MPIIQPEKRFLSLETAEIRAQKSEKGTILTGYAAKFGKLSQDLGGFVEKIDKNAFDRCLTRCDVRGLKNHDPGQLLGRTGSGTMRLSVDDTGLKYEIDVPDTQTGRDTVTEIERGDISGSSFSFSLTNPGGDMWEGDWDDDEPPTRTILEVKDLFDVGPVTYPAYPDTEASMRSFKSHVESRELARRGQVDQLKRLRILKVRLGHFILERGNCGKAQSDAS